MICTQIVLNLKPQIGNTKMKPATKLEKGTVAIFTNQEMEEAIELVRVTRESEGNPNKCNATDNHGSIAYFTKSRLIPIARDCNPAISLELGEWFPGKPGIATLTAILMLARLQRNLIKETIQTAESFVELAENVANSLEKFSPLDEPQD